MEENSLCLSTAPVRVETLVLGGGVSGLAAAWTRQQLGEEVFLLDAQPQLGGWLRSTVWHGRGLELGPRTFSASRTPLLLHWLQTLGLGHQVQKADRSAHVRYLLDGHRLVRIPPTLKTLLTVPLLRGALWELLREPWVRRTPLPAESIASFVTARWGPHVAQICEAVVRGIWAGGIEDLEAAACLPQWVQRERRYGSVLSMRKGSPRWTPPAALPQKGLWRLDGGCQQLVQVVAKQLIAGGAQLGLEERVLEIRPVSGRWWVRSNRRTFLADRLISALPTHALQQIRAPWGTALPPTQAKSLTLHHLYWKRRLPLPPGFGYLVMGPAEQGLLGSVFESQIFPQTWEQGTHVTLFQEDSDTSPVDLFCRHTHMPLPDDQRVTACPQAVPQYEVGFLASCAQFQQELVGLPPCLFLGASWGGVSVEDCVRQGLIQSREWDGCAPRVFVPPCSPFA